MTKQEILDEFNDINYVYNKSSKHETLSWMLDELLKEQKAVPADTKMTDKNTVMSWLEGLTQDDWQKWYSDSEVQETAKAALKVMKGLYAKRVLSDRQCEISPHHYERKGFCPKCHQEVKFILNRNYCGFCGQEIKWND